VEEKRAALAQIVDRVEFDPATGNGRVFYRIGFSGARFQIGEAAKELGIGQTGVWLASPRGFDAGISALAATIQLPMEARAPAT
jgi:hypothetical protein